MPLTRNRFGNESTPAVNNRASRSCHCDCEFSSSRSDRANFLLCVHRKLETQAPNVFVYDVSDNNLTSGNEASNVQYGHPLVKYNYASFCFANHAPRRAAIDWPIAKPPPGNAKSIHKRRLYRNLLQLVSTRIELSQTIELIENVRGSY